MKKKAEYLALQKLRDLGPPSQFLNQVRLLPEGMTQALREMIVQGASPEFATDEVNKRHDWDGTPKEETHCVHPVVHPVVTIQAVQQYCRADLDLQRDRAHYLVQTAEAITRSLSESGDLEEGECRYVHAVVMSGLTRINQGDSSLSTKEALRAREEVLNLRLKNWLMRLKKTEASRHNSYLTAQKELALAKKKFVNEQTRKLQDAVRKLAKKRNITPETLRKIQETYGILAQNVAETTLGPSAEELQALPAGSPLESGEAIEAPEPYYFVSPERVAQELADPRDAIIKASEEMGGPEEEMPDS